MKKLIISIVILSSLLFTYYSYLQTNFQHAMNGVDRIRQIYDQAIEESNSIAQNTTEF